MSDANVSTATAAPSEVKLQGKTYLAGRLRLRDYGYLEQWMRDCLVKSGREAIKDPELNLTDKAIILQEAYNAGAKITFSRPSTCQGFLSSIEGGLRICWLALRLHNPMPPDQHLMTLEEAENIVVELDDIKQITDIAIEKADQVESALKKADGKTDDESSDPIQSPTSSDSSPKNINGPSQ